MDRPAMIALLIVILWMGATCYMIWKGKDRD
jgi:hypothetical protein